MKKVFSIALLCAPGPALSQGIMEEIECNLQTGMQYDVMSHECVTLEEYQRRHGGTGAASNQNSEDTGHNDGTWHDVVPNYPEYAAGVPKPWNENPDVWYTYFNDNYDRECTEQSFGGTQRCAEVFAEFVRFGLCYSSQYDPVNLAAWQDSQRRLYTFLDDYNVQPPDRSYWSC